jgi:cytochrome c
MESFEINKVLGALLATCLVLVTLHIASGAIFTRGELAKPGYEIAVKEEQPGKNPAARRPGRQTMRGLSQFC